MFECKKCGGKLQSKGIRRQTRRYRCVLCGSNAGSIPITEEEAKLLRLKDKGIGNLNLTERYEEIAGLKRLKKQPYCLLPTYDPKYCCQLSKDTQINTQPHRVADRTKHLKPLIKETFQ